jgi:hypothetical protein
MFVASIQGIIRSFDEEFSPFEERCGQKSGNHAKNDPLRKCPVHPPAFKAGVMPVK